LIAAVAFADPEAEDKIKQGRIKYLSPAFGPVEDDRGRKFSFALREASLVAAPHQKNLSPGDSHVLGAEHKEGDMPDHYDEKSPEMMDDKDKGEEARKLFDDAQQMLTQIIKEGWLTAKAVIGFWPANSVDDDIEVYSDDSRSELLTTLHNLRQQQQKADNKPNRCLTDFVAPRDTKIKDYIGAFAVTAGIGIDAHVERFEKQHDDYSAIMIKALADRLAEAFAERLHQRVRKEFWGYGSDETLSNEELIKEQYKGIRPAAGYPACPDHTEKDLIWDLLHAEKNTGIWLTESRAMVPTASVSGVYFSHPEAVYFAVGKINRDQVESYAARKGFSVAETERWLAPNLGYDV